MQPTLVILAAGMASRYGSMKQIQAFGPSGETIMEYSIYDAIHAGFGKVVFIIREEFADIFKASIEPKLKGKIAIDYVYQKLESFTNNCPVNPSRKKPWGTAHAVLCCKDKVKEPFAVINADDFYGRDAFVKAVDFLKNRCNDKTYCIVGYELIKTLSENGSVSRGVCKVDDSNNLIEVNERTKIYKNEQGKVTYEDESDVHEVPENSLVSMNFICFAPNVIGLCEELFKDRNSDDPKSEFYLPFITNQFIHSGRGDVKVVPTTAQWFGVTYKEDAPGVLSSIRRLVADGEYPSNLWA